MTVIYTEPRFIGKDAGGTNTSDMKERFIVYAERKQERKLDIMIIWDFISITEKKQTINSVLTVEKSYEVK